MVDALLLLNRRGCVDWADSGAARLCGREQNELRGLSCEVLFAQPQGPALRTDGIRNAVTRISSGDAAELRGSGDLLLPTGASVPLLWHLSEVPQRSGGDFQIAATLQLRLPAETDASVYRDIFEHAVEGIFRTSLDGRYLEVNRALAEMYGYTSPAELIGALQDINSQLYVDPNRRGEFVRLIQEQGIVADFQSEIFRADGSTLWISEYARTVRGRDGRAPYFEGSVVDVTARKMAEIALRQSEEKFRRLLETTHVVPWEADLQTGRFTYVGPQAVAFLGYTTDEWLTQNFWRDRVHPDDREWAAIVRAEVISKRQSFECEYRMVRADDRVIWIREIFNVSPGENGRSMLGGFIFDVTHRREAEESLRESQHFIEQIASASPTILYLYDPVREQCIYVNGRVLDILGYSQKALSEMHPLFIFALAHPDEMAAHERHLEQLPEVPLGTIMEREFRLRSAIGSWVWLSCRESVFKQDAAGRPLQIVGIAEDITLQRKAIEELEANEALFRKLAETTGVTPFEFHAASKRFTYVGPQAERLFGYPLRLWHRPGFWESIVHADDFDRGLRFCREGRGDERRDSVHEFRVRAADGRPVWIRQIVHCGEDEDDRTFIRGFLLDVTETKQIEEERERSSQELRELTARSQLIREEERISIARELHDELGQALTMFKIDLGWLSARLAKNVPAQSRAPLEQKLETMAQLADTTLQAVRRIASQLRPPLLDELGLADAIEWQTEDFSRRVGIRCEVQLEPVEPLAKNIATAVFRIFQEIMTNIARHAQATRVRVRMRATDSGLILRVEDNGRGLSREQSGNVKSFGLLGMRERAWAVGGKVEIDGRLKLGTTVTLTIPYAPSAK